VIVVWFCLEAIIRIGIWCGFLWLKKVEDFTATLFLVILGLIFWEFYTLQIALESMAEMQEYIDRRLEGKEDRHEGE
jgi:hypothetical protein